MTADVYEELRAAITTGRMHPNERLVESDLVEMFGASRSAVRTALVRLEQAGLVQHERNRGAKVRLVDVSEAIEIYEVRTALESLAARKAAEVATAADREELTTILTTIRERLADDDLALASDGNADLHAAILRIAGQKTVARLVSGLNTHLVRFQYRTIMQPDRPQLSFDEHSAVVKAICDGDGDTAESAMRTHLSKVTGTLRRPLPQRTE